MVIIILLILAAFVTVLVCLKHKTTSESERRWGRGCAGCTSPSRLLCFIYASTGWPLPQSAVSECPFTAYERAFERNWNVNFETLRVVFVAKHGFTCSCLPLAMVSEASLVQPLFSTKDSLCLCGWRDKTGGCRTTLWSQCSLTLGRQFYTVLVTCLKTYM